MFKFIFLLLIITLNSLFAYSAHCIVTFFNSDRSTEFDITVNNKVLTEYKSWGTYQSHYKGRKGSDYYYYAVDKNGFEANTYIGKISNGKMSYYSVADDGYGFKGICTLK